MMYGNRSSKDVKLLFRYLFFVEYERTIWWPCKILI